MTDQEHWDRVYQTKSADAVSWFQLHATRSLAIIRATGLPQNAPIIDVGGGTSILVDDLLEAGFSRLTVLDISAQSLALARARLGERASSVRWIAADIRTVNLPEHQYEIWHDRAVFHFLTEPADRSAYIRQVKRSVKPGGHVVVATFAPDGPEKCSGLEVRRYSPDQLHDEFGTEFELVDHTDEQHVTPWGFVQPFIYCHCIVRPSRRTLSA